MDRINQTALSLVCISIKFATFEQFSFNPTFSTIFYHIDSFELYSFKEQKMNSLDLKIWNIIPSKIDGRN